MNDYDRYNPTDALWITKQWRDDGASLTFDGKLLAVTVDKKPIEWPSFDYAAKQLGFETLAMVELSIIQKRVLPWRDTFVTLHFIKKGRAKICKHCGQFADYGHTDGRFWVSCKCGLFDSFESMRSAVLLWRHKAKNMELWRAVL
jgi:hypothetical protein